MGHHHSMEHFSWQMRYPIKINEISGAECPGHRRVSYDMPRSNHKWFPNDNELVQWIPQLPLFKWEPIHSLQDQNYLEQTSCRNKENFSTTLV